MKEKAGNNIKLGVFIFVGILMFIIGIYFIGQRQQLFSSTFVISGVFKDISGLQVGNNVRFSGINVGIIEHIEQITDSTVRVDMLINENSRKFIKKNAKALIGSDGLMGNRILLIIPGPANNNVIANNDRIETAQSVSMDDILKNVKITSENAAKITNDLSVITENMRNGKGTIGKLFIDSTFADHLEDALINIKLGAGGFKQNMDAASHNVLLRGFLKKKEKAKEEKEREKEKEKEKEEKEKIREKEEKENKKE